jgi:hypothetical protein
VFPSESPKGIRDINSYKTMLREHAREDLREPRANLASAWNANSQLCWKEVLSHLSTQCLHDSSTQETVPGVSNAERTESPGSTLWYDTKRDSESIPKSGSPDNRKLKRFVMAITASSAQPPDVKSIRSK